MWVLRTRLRLARHGCSLEITAPRGVVFDAPPHVQPTPQHFPEEERRGRGTLRINLGECVNLGRDLTIEVLPSADNRLRLDDRVVCYSGVRLVLFGGSIEVGPWSRLRDGVMLKSSGRLVCGSHTVLQGGTSLHAANEVVLEDHVGIGEQVIVMDSDHLADGSDVIWYDQPLATGPVHLGRNAWIGAHVVILRDARIGRNAIVAAASVVRGGDYPAGWLIVGAPATAKRELPGAAAREHAG